MKWTGTVVLAVVAFVIGILVSYLRFQDREAKLVQEKDKECAEKMAAMASKVAKWETLEDGTRVVRLWKTAGPEWPELAVLELPAQNYKTLKENPSEYMNKENIFPKKVNPGAHCVELTAASKEYAGLWYAIAPHKNPSWSLVAAFPAEVTKAEEAQGKEPGVAKR